MKLIPMEVGGLGTNCYILYCETTKEAAIIDPGSDGDRILRQLTKHNLKPVCIINTHGHGDHIGANTAVKEATGVPVYIHRDDAAMLTSAAKNLSTWLGPGFTCDAADKLLEDGDIVQVGTISMQVIHTPGHTPGGICLKAGDIVISGDTLFAESIGRSDFPGGSHSQLIASIKNRLMTLSDDVTVYPGHGPETTIGWERKTNPFLV